MLYALLIYEAEDVSESYSDADMEQALEGHRNLQNDTKADGVFVEANQLMPAGSATSVRVRNGEVSVMDGPFAETKELLLGLYVVDCGTLDQAVEYARRIPHAETGGIEVRPVAYFERSGSDQLQWPTSD